MSRREEKCILKNKRGASIIWVLILIVVIFIIGASIISAAFATQTVRKQYQDNKDCMYYAKTVAKILETDITAPLKIDTQNPWYIIAQEVYAANYGKTGAEAAQVEIPDGGFSLPGLPDDSWIGKSGAVNLKIELTNQRVDVITDYHLTNSGVPDNSEDDPSEILEITNVSFEMHIQIKIIRNKQQYILNEIFQFTGDTVGTPGKGEKSGNIQSGQFLLKAISAEDV